MTEPDDDREDRKWVWPHPGDLGAVLFAAIFLVAMIGTILWLFSSPDPFLDLFGKKPVDNGEVTITLQKK